jgi:nucleolar protein 53
VGSGKSSKTVKRPAKHETSVLPSIEAPHPGMSYNPSFDDHQDLLKAIADKELKIIKEEKHLNRVTKGMFSKVTVDQKEVRYTTFFLFSDLFLLFFSLHG